MSTKKRHEWKASHYLTSDLTGLRVPVMLETNGLAFTREEWKNETQDPVFTRGQDGVWYENGGVLPNEAVEVMDRDIPVMDDEAARVVGRMSQVASYTKNALKAIGEGEDGYRPADRVLRCLIAEAQAARCDIAPAIKAIEEREAKAAKDRAEEEKKRKAAEYGPPIPGIGAGSKKGD